MVFSLICLTHSREFNFCFVLFILEKMEMSNMGYSSHHHRERHERRYSVPQGPNLPMAPTSAAEDLHAWSIYR